MADPPLVLVVDDEQSYRDALSVALQREGFLVEVAADGLVARMAVEMICRGADLVAVVDARIAPVCIGQGLQDCVAGGRAAR